MNYKYVILPLSELSEALVDMACETSLSTLRVSRHGRIKIVLKCLGSQLEQRLNCEPLTHEQILVEMRKPEWQADEEST